MSWRRRGILSLRAGFFKCLLIRSFWDHSYSAINLKKNLLPPIKLKTHNEQTSTKFHQDLSLEIEALRQEWTQVPFNLKDLNEHIDNTISNNNFNQTNSESNINIDDIDIKNDRSLDNISNTSNPNSQSHLMQLNNSHDNSLNASPVRSKNVVNVQNDDLRGTKSEIRGHTCHPFISFRNSRYR